ncbi:DNA primase [Streptomyces longisporoflavus]|uniref:bifunctional DNA primase/polymerase n=1 Tax=Streptomyces longisporoflavus TaxID=28044 RepID=UPI00167CB4C5|nr:bifunctional DNA primase/polymerase [Streptomyces longisporoflavus]GGV59240.1 DNA primase [Streptomyces longisporoflavus]
MGFTIGGIRGTDKPRTGSRRRGRASDCTAVAEYTGLWGWAAVPGARALDGRCSCGAADCAAPGAHPLAFAPEVPAGATLDEVTEAWARFPGAAVLLPVGRAFDVLEVAEAAGRRALLRLERMGLPLGPVAATPDGRAHFFVAPGAAVELPQLLYRMGWDDAGLDLHGRGPGSHLTAPPSDHAGLGPVRWLRAPDLDSATHPPQARLILGTLAYVAHRSPA